ncbi:MAG: IS3 family transposase, partial [Hyphomicrobiaceae bacterium]|nr:IS3 family transposase [Hyphomicrobiaceae bacterium]
MIETTEALGKKEGVAQACRVLGVPRSRVYRARKPKTERAPRPTPPRALSVEEKAEIRAVLNSERFCDSAPREVYATLLDEDSVYYCHWRTMYRILEEHDEVCERRKQRRHPKRAKPELRATGPRQVWTWDITQLRGPGRFYYLYTIIDVFSRYAVGWMIAHQDSSELARQLIAETCAKQGIERDRLILHADRGSAMRSKTVRELLVDLGVSKSHSRPHTPTDNPYSEAQFKTMKYRPDYPEAFQGITHARLWARAFFGWYNQEHHHTGLALMTPATVHYGQAQHVHERRQKTLDAAYAAHPQR